MARLILLHKPFGVLSQFTDPRGRPTLASCVVAPGCHPCGRLDQDSEGLLLLCDDGRVQAWIARHAEKRYVAQVEADPDAARLARVVDGVRLGDGPSRALSAQVVPAPAAADPARTITAHRAARSHWVEVVMRSGRNREVRRLLAACGMPVLRLLRVQIAHWHLGDLAPGTWREERIHPPTRPPQPRSQRRAAS